MFVIHSFPVISNANKTQCQLWKRLTGQWIDVSIVVNSGEIYPASAGEIYCHWGKIHTGEIYPRKIYPLQICIPNRAGTRLFKNRRLIEYLKEATRSARLGTRSVLGAAGKFEIWIIFDIKQSKKCQHKTSTEAERVFSWMGWLLNKRRLSMSGETVSMQLFLKDNLVLWTFVSFWLLYLYLAFW